MLHKHLNMKPYRLQLHQALSQEDNNSQHREFCTEFQEMLEDEDKFEKLNVCRVT